MKRMDQAAGAGRQERGGEQLAHWITRCVSRIYLDTFGTFEGLRGVDNLRLLKTAGLEARLGGLSEAERRHFCVQALGHLWAKARGQGDQRFVDWRVMFYSLSAGRTLGEAIMRGSECYDALEGRNGKFLLNVKNGQAELHIDTLVRPPTLASCLFSLIGIAEFHSLFEWLIAQPLPVTHAYLSSDPATFGEMRPSPDAFPFPFTLGAAWSGFSFPSEFLDRPVERLNEDILTRPKRNFLFQIDDGDALHDTARRVHRIAMQALQRDWHMPSFEEIAVSESLSPVTLRRRLRDQDMTYREIKESCRKEVGLRLIRDSNLSIEDIAVRLDYCDSDAFRRAFRAWMGTSPSRLRNDLREQFRGSPERC